MKNNVDNESMTTIWALFEEKHVRLHFAGNLSFFLKNHHWLFGLLFRVLSFWRTTATVVKKFPMKRIRKQRPHVKTWKHKEQNMSKHTVVFSILMDEVWMYSEVLWSYLHINKYKALTCHSFKSDSFAILKRVRPLKSCQNYTIKHYMDEYIKNKKHQYMQS